MSVAKPAVTILCAGPGLGFYIPGVIAHRQLVSNGINAEVEVFETFLTVGKQHNLPKAKQSFHRNFSFALMGQHLAKDPSPYLDDVLVDALLGKWQQEQRRHFIVYSGFWVPVIMRYRQMGVNDLNVELCHVDAANSTSWGLFTTVTRHEKHIWFNSWETKTVNYYQDVAKDCPVIPFNQRDGRYIIHGGGWGMGTYKQRIAGLNQLGLQLDVLAYEQQDVENMDDRNRYYMIDPAWNSWQKNAAGQYGFPPLGEIITGREISYRDNDTYPAVYDVLRTKKAIISKPGAGTLMDSISSATPLLYIEPFGEYEKNNAELWKYHGLGMPLDEWTASGCSDTLLHECHLNLIAIKKQAVDYVDSYLKKLSHGI